MDINISNVPIQTWKSNWKVTRQPRYFNALAVLITYLTVNLLFVTVIATLYIAFRPISEGEINPVLPSSPDNIYVNNYNSMLLYSSLVTYLLIIIISVFVAKPFFSSHTKTFKDKEFARNTFKYAGIFFGIYLVAMIIVSVLVQSGYALFNDDLLTDHGTSTNQELVEDMVNSHLVVGFFVVVIFGPIVEELVFRASIFNLFKTRTNGFIVSVLVFALIHLLASVGTGQTTDLWYLPVYLTISVVLCASYVSSNENLMVSTMTHVFVNSIAFISLVLSN